MSHLILNVFKTQRMDLTANVKDTDVVLEAFRKYHVKFEKKYTSLHPNGPCTITFKGLHSESAHSDLSDMIFELYEKARDDEIGNVYVKFTNFIRKAKQDFETVNSEEPVTTYAEVPPCDDTL